MQIVDFQQNEAYGDFNLLFALFLLILGHLRDQDQLAPGFLGIMHASKRIGVCDKGESISNFEPKPFDGKEVCNGSSP